MARPAQQGWTVDASVSLAAELGAPSEVELAEESCKSGHEAAAAGWAVDGVAHINSGSSVLDVTLPLADDHASERLAEPTSDRTVSEPLVGFSDRRHRPREKPTKRRVRPINTPSIAERPEATCRTRNVLVGIGVVAFFISFGVTALPSPHVPKTMVPASPQERAGVEVDSKLPQLPSFLLQLGAFSIAFGVGLAAVQLVLDARRGRGRLTVLCQSFHGLREDSDNEKELARQVMPDVLS